MSPPMISRLTEQRMNVMKHEGTARTEVHGGIDPFHRKPLFLRILCVEICIHMAIETRSVIRYPVRNIDHI